MEYNQGLELLKQQLKDNIINWYPMEDNTQYIILKEFSKKDEYKLKEAVEKLNDKGRILILMDNRLGIKNVCIKDCQIEELYSRKEIEKLLNQIGLRYRKFYYPLPNCEMTNVIFTDNHLPDEETISRNISFYKVEDVELNKENDVYKNILKEDISLFKIFANSFFIECSKNEFQDNNIEFVSFSNMRKEEYRIKTIIKGDYVYKQSLNEKSIDHIKNIERNIDILNKCNINTLDRYENLKIISAYQKNKDTLDKVLIKKLKQGDVEEAKAIMKNLYIELQQKLEVIETDKNVCDKYDIQYEAEDIKNLKFIKYGFWDMILQNIFYIDGKYFFYDQEWFEENIPIEFIIYRMIIYCPEFVKNLNLKKFLMEFNITDKNISLFQILDNKLQEKTRSDSNWKIHIQINNFNNVLENLNARCEEVKNLKEDKEKITEDCKKLLNEKDARIKFLEDNMENTVKLLHEKENKITLMENSTSWKITEPLRKIRGRKGAKNENKR